MFSKIKSLFSALSGSNTAETKVSAPVDTTPVNPTPVVVPKAFLEHHTVPKPSKPAKARKKTRKTSRKASADNNTVTAITPTEANRIVSDYKNGTRVAEIINKTGRSKSAIYLVLRKAGVLSPYRNSSVRIHGNAIAKLWNANLSVSEIAEKLGVPYNVVHRYIREVLKEKSTVKGGPARAAKVTKNSKITQISAMWDKGYSLKEISEKGAIPYSTVHHHVRHTLKAKGSVKAGVKKHQSRAGRKSVLTDAEIKTAIREFRKGTSLRAIRSKLGNKVSYQAIDALLRRRGVK